MHLYGICTLSDGVWYLQSSNDVEVETVTIVLFARKYLWLRRRPTYEGSRMEGLGLDLSFWPPDVGVARCGTLLIRVSHLESSTATIPMATTSW